MTFRNKGKTLVLVNRSIFLCYFNDFVNRVHKLKTVHISQSVCERTFYSDCNKKNSQTVCVTEIYSNCGNTKHRAGREGSEGREEKGREGREGGKGRKGRETTDIY